MQVKETRERSRGSGAKAEQQPENSKEDDDERDDDEEGERSLVADQVPGSGEREGESEKRGDASNNLKRR